MADAITNVGAELNLQHYAGDTLPLVITATDNNNQPIDVSQYLFKMQVKKRLRYNEPPLMTLSLGNGITLGGLVNIVILNWQHPQLRGRLYYYDLEVTLPNGTIQSWLYGTIDMMQDVTNSTDES